VTYLTSQMGYDLVLAGLVLAATQAAGVDGRLLAGTWTTGWARGP